VTGLVIVLVGVVFGIMILARRESSKALEGSDHDVPEKDA